MLSRCHGTHCFGRRGKQVTCSAAASCASCYTPTANLFLTTVVQLHREIWPKNVRQSSHRDLCAVSSGHHCVSVQKENQALLIANDIVTWLLTNTFGCIFVVHYICTLPLCTFGITILFFHLVKPVCTPSTQSGESFSSCTTVIGTAVY